MVSIIWAFVVGLCFGSLANVLIYRLPLKRSIVKPQSACTACGEFIATYDLLPVLSWVMLKGRCRCCRAFISLRYPLVELACGLLFAGMVLLTPTISAVFLSAFAFILLVISYIDWDTQEIYDGLLIIAALVGVIWVVCSYFFVFPLAPCFINAVLGILVGAAPLFVLDKLTLAIYKKDGFGYGDVKLMAVSGLFLGWQYVLMAFFFAFLSGGFYATILLITGRAKSGEYIAFGPFLSSGVISALWFGRALLEFAI